MLAELQQRIAEGETPLSLTSEIVTAVVARRGEHGHHAAWGILCEQAGLLSLAFTEFQLALRDDRHDEVAAPRLAVHYRERGDFERATKLLEMLLARDAMRTDWLEPYCELLAEDGALPRIDAAIQRAEKWGLSPAAAARLRAAWLPARKKPAAGPDAHEPASPAFAPTDADCIRMHTLFAGQEGVYARQWAKPGGETGYTPIHEPLTPAVIRQHFTGQFTVGVYPVRHVDEHRRLSHDEQLVLIHSLGHVEGGPQAVNYLLNKCIDVGPEKLMKDRLKGNPVSCPSIRKKIPHITRRVACSCPFEFAADRYPTPVLHLLTLKETAPAPTVPAAGIAALAERFSVLDRRHEELQREWQILRTALIDALAASPERQVACGGGSYRLEEKDGLEELLWHKDE